MTASPIISQSAFPSSAWCTEGWHSSPIGHAAHALSFLEEQEGENLTLKYTSRRIERFAELPLPGQLLNAAWRNRHGATIKAGLLIFDGQTQLAKTQPSYLLVAQSDRAKWNLDWEDPYTQFVGRDYLRETKNHLPLCKGEPNWFLPEATDVEHVLSSLLADGTHNAVVLMHTAEHLGEEHPDLFEYLPASLLTSVYQVVLSEDQDEEANAVLESIGSTQQVPYNGATILLPARSHPARGLELTPAPGMSRELFLRQVAGRLRSLAEAIQPRYPEMNLLLKLCEEDWRELRVPRLIPAPARPAAPAPPPAEDDVAAALAEKNRELRKQLEEATEQLNRSKTREAEAAERARLHEAARDEEGNPPPGANDELEQLRKELEQAREENARLKDDYDTCEELLTEQEEQLATLKSRVRVEEGVPPEADEWDEEGKPLTWGALLAHASGLPGVRLSENAPRQLSGLRGHTLEKTWVRRTFDSLLALSSYAVQKKELGKATAATVVPNFSRYLEWDKARKIVPVSWYESKEANVRAAPQSIAARTRTFEVPGRGPVLMDAHFRVGSGGPPAPRMHIFDDTFDSGTVYVGYIGPHLVATRQRTPING